MWKCQTCGEQIDDEFDVCWQCGTSIEGELDPHFEHADPPPPPAEALIAWNRLGDARLVVENSRFRLIVLGLLLLLSLTTATFGSLLLNPRPAGDADTLVYVAGAAALASLAACLLVPFFVPMRLELDLTVRIRYLLRTREFDRAEIESIGVEHMNVLHLFWMIPVWMSQRLLLHIRCKDGPCFTFTISAASEHELRRLTDSGGAGPAPNASHADGKD